MCPYQLTSALVYVNSCLNSERFRFSRSVFADNHCLNNGDAGMAMLESSNASISGNVFEHNKYGVRMSVGCSGNMVSNNTIFNTTK